MVKMGARSFTAIDYVVLAASLVISVGIGVFYAFKDRRHNTSSNYFLGDRKLGALPVGLSYVVTFQSAILILGSPAEVYLYGLQYIVMLLGCFIGIILSALVVVPLFHPLDITSVYEYYNLRYGTNSLRFLGVALGATYYVLYMGIVLFGTGLALESTAGLPLWTSVVMFSSAAVIYTAIGGIKAVIWTDVFQTLIMFSGILAVLIKSIPEAGGPSKIPELSKDRFNLFDFNPDPTVRHTFWTLTLGAIPQYFYMTITQAGVQRIICTPSIKSAKRLLFIASPIFCIMSGLAFCEGTALFAYFSSKGCDPIASGQVVNANQLIPFTILEMFHNLPGMPGLFIAALAAASLSTISSGLSGLSAVLCIDVLMVCKPQIKDQTATNISKLFVVLLGIFSASLAIVLSNIKGPLTQIMAGLSGAVAGPETGMFLVSAFFKRSRPKAVFFATVVGLTINLWINFGQTFSSNVVQAPKLPLGPTGNCSVTYETNTIDSSLNMNNISQKYQDYSEFTSRPIVYNFTNQNEYQETPSNQRSGLDTFYSISYMYFHLIGTVITILLAVIGSLLTQLKRPVHVNENYVLHWKFLCPSKLSYTCCSEKNQPKGKDKTYELEMENMIGEKNKGLQK